MNVLVAAILAGASVGVWIGLDPRHLSPAAYVEQQQSMLGALRLPMVALVIFATILSVTSAVVQRHDRPVFVGLLLAAVFFIACILITTFGNKPIDDVVLAWTPGSLPGNWTQLRDRWRFLHVLRALAELAALMLVIWTSIRKGMPARPGA